MDSPFRPTAISPFLLSQIAQQGADASAPPPTPDAPVNPGWAARLFAGTDPLASGLLDPQEARALGRNALTQFGISLLQNSGPSPYRRGLGELLGTALQSGQQAYQQGVAGTLGAQQSVAQRLAASRLEALRMRYAGRSDPDSMRQYMLGLIGEGDYHGASAISEYLKSQEGADTRGVPVATLDPQGRPITQFVNPTNGAPIGQPLARQPERDPSVAADNVALNQDIGAFRRTEEPNIKKFVDSYWRATNHIAEARQGNPVSYKAAVSQFIQTAEPGNQLRLGMLQYLQDVDPSVQGRADIALQKLENGTWDPKYLDGMQRLMDSNFHETMQRYQSSYDDFIQRNPNAARRLTPPDVLFGTRAMSHGASPATGGNVNPITGRPRGR